MKLKRNIWLLTLLHIWIIIKLLYWYKNITWSVIIIHRIRLYSGDGMEGRSNKTTTYELNKKVTNIMKRSLIKNT